MLRFRNIDATPDDPVSHWGVEGIASALERGYLPHWQRIARAVRAEPYGPVAEQLETALDVVGPAGGAALLRRVLDEARATDAEAVAAHVRGELRRSGLTARAFAGEAGTSASRLSTYTRGKVTPSATMLRRIDRVAARHARRISVHPGRSLGSAG